MKRILLLLTVLLLASCGQREKNTHAAADDATVDQKSEGELPDSVRARKFSPVFPTVDSLFSIYISAIAERDTATLASLLVTEEEFQHWLWPEFPMSDPAMNVPEGFAWRNLAIKSDKGLRRMLRDLGGRRYSITRLRFVEGVEKYASFEVWSGTRVDVLDERGKSVELAYAGSIVQLNGTHKLMSYKE
ncbi:MAG: hypothetical protein M5R41_06985 [Bacteroidia bacterium]|nr:hypothetical protein [Bacteroidia bacterium]